MYLTGIDVGSTTVKLVVLGDNKEILFSKYERHFSDVKSATKKVLEEFREKFGQDTAIKIMITGSGGIGLAEVLEISFVQEVVSCTRAIEEMIPETDVAIELGGEDAKITFFEGSLEQRMNGSCAGGTGAFIDQMASLLKTDAPGVNELAKNYQNIYPIASRCGVFAKTDVQPLINEGARKEDIAASIFQAVVNQTIAGLASGRKIVGNIAFLGGPLYFMSELRRRFIETLDIQPENIVFPENPQLFVALGAAFYATDEKEVQLSTILEKLDQENHESMRPTDVLDVLFETPEEYAAFQKRHNQSDIPRRCLSEYSGKAYLGIDAGSTTTKLILLSENEEILYEFYGNNEGKPLENVIEKMIEIYDLLPAHVEIANSCVTGYGEHLIKNALKIGFGEVETMAHYKAANHFKEGVDFILDIGGQDMKAMTIKNRALSSIQLNEACSSGCGSFIETFAKSLHFDVKDFAKEALLATHPVDLGSRCTVFMNSKVKQVQKEGASVGDISAGLSYSVIKNAIFKVIKVRRPEDLGENIVVQGGTFYNDAILRAFEKVTGREVIRPTIAGLMGAFGAALIAKENWDEEFTHELLPVEALQTFTTDKEFVNCGLCENNCKMTLTVFSDGRKFVSGNRCERGAEKAMEVRITRGEKLTNLVAYKYKRLYQYRPLTAKNATHGEIGIPRVLNIYENYPLWHTFFTELGFRVVLSPRSSKELYELGMDTIPSDTACYPAKIAHGHIQALIEKKVDRIFYPGVIFEREENKNAANIYNCPIVQSYPEVIRNNVDEIRFGQVEYHQPFINLANQASVEKSLFKEFKHFGITQEQVEVALQKGYDELENFKEDVRRQGEEAILRMNLRGEKGVVLSGRPYHLDPEINHGIAEVILQEGFHVLTEDAVSHLAEVENLRVVDQWVYHSRLYAAAKVVAKSKNLELVQLNSFGCGLDAVTTDQVEEIMNAYGKLYTVLKIDEGSNLGAIRIRLRSLKAAVEERKKQNIQPILNLEPDSVVTFTKDLRKRHTLLMPMLSPIHQTGLMDEAFKSCGYDVVVLPEVKNAIDEGLKFVNNDACYPAIISIGQLIEALQSGQYDVNNTSVMMSQTGGGCRATNYIPLLRKALKDAGFSQVPIVSLSMGNKGVEETPGFKWSIPLFKRIIIGFMYGDLFERVVYRTRPYEVNEGEIDALHEKWLKVASKNVRSGSFFEFNRNMKKIIREFDNIPLRDIVKPRVGVVGEILVKYSPVANNDIVRLLESEGAEAVVPDIIGFMNYSLYNQIWRYENLGMSKKAKQFSELGIKFIEFIEKPMHKELVKSKRFDGIAKIDEIARGAETILSVGNHTGEGWFLTGEMVELLREGVNNIVCMQPFGCLPNHVVGKGVIKELRHQYPKSNIAAIDYDPGVSIVNQLNRIRLMLASAKKNMEKEEVSVQTN